MAPESVRPGCRFLLTYGEFVLYETSAIVAYLEEVFPGGPALTAPEQSRRDRALMNQWISAVNSYYYYT